MRSSKSRSRSKSNRNRNNIGNVVNRVFDSSGTPRYPVDSEIEPIHELI